MSPLDLERKFGLIGGDIFHGALIWISCSRRDPCSATPITAVRSKALYMCGAGTHPGGGVTGAPGHNAAREIIQDFRRRRLR